MKVRELIAVLLDCDPELDVVNYVYEDCIALKEETVRHVKANGDKYASSHVILEFSEDKCY